VFLLHGKQIRTSGNKHAHLVLRGGGGKGNITKDDIQKAIKLMGDNKVQNPTIIVDVSHDNCIDCDTGKKDHTLQGDTLHTVLDLIKSDKNINEHVKGFMIESFMKRGKQNLDKAESADDLDMDGLSITDACLSIEETKQVVEELYNKLP